jgi:hypothetical protein
MCTMTDAEHFEKTIVFGGITHSKTSTNNEESNHLSNDLYIIEVR